MKKFRNKRFANRSLEFFDIHHRFEAEPVSMHRRTAQGAIERLRDEGNCLWSEDQKQLHRWREYCNVLWAFIVTDLGKRRNIQNQDLQTALREFISEFEHSTHGMYEMLYGTFEGADSDTRIRNFLQWVELAYRASTYAILSYWIDEKHDELTITTMLRIDINQKNSPQIDAEETVVYKPMKNPKLRKHRRGIKIL